jgi:hypothetical protein
MLCPFFFVATFLGGVRQCSFLFFVDSSHHLKRECVISTSIVSLYVWVSVYVCFPCFISMLSSVNEIFYVIWVFAVSVLNDRPVWPMYGRVQSIHFSLYSPPFSYFYLLCCFECLSVLSWSLKSSVKPITNINPVYSHSYTWQYFEGHIQTLLCIL